MDILLSVAGNIFLKNFQGLRVSCRNGINADGYVPEGSGAARRNTGQQWADHQKRTPSQHPTASDVDSLGLLIGKVGVQIAGMALVSYMSARMFQYAMRGSDRMLQESAKDSLKCKLPHRSDIDIDKLSLDSHEIMVSMVRERESYSESYLSAAAFRTVATLLHVEALRCSERLCYGLGPSSLLPKADDAPQKAPTKFSLVWKKLVQNFAFVDPSCQTFVLSVEVHPALGCFR